MKLPIVIIVKEEGIEYHLELNSKVTIVTDIDCKGESELAGVLTDDYEFKELYVSESEYTCVQIRGVAWAQMFSDLVNGSNHGLSRFIFVLDDVDYIFTEKFAEIFNRDVHNLYIIINRFQGARYLNLPFSTDNVYTMSQIMKSIH